ncbi:MAG: hypothetical protein AB2692_18770 [Candidatus Thiodiazotropha sp.]
MKRENILQPLNPAIIQDLNPIAIKMDDLISETKIETAYIQAAKIVSKYGEKYLPIFERLENELHERRKRSAIIKRVYEVALRTEIDT